MYFNNNNNNNNNNNPIQIQEAEEESAAVCCLMDSRIWRHLPPPLIDRILAFLPPAAFFRCRAVCKRFYSLLFSSSFLNLHLSLPSLHPSFLFFSSSSSNSSSLFLFHPTLLTWHNLPLMISTTTWTPTSYLPLASSSGLLLLLSTLPGPKSILLVNPLSKLTTQIPPSLRHRLLPSAGLAAGPSSLTIILAGDDMISPFAVKNLTSETFHADGPTGFFSPWSTLSPLPRLCSIHPPTMVFSNNRFYCMSCSPFSVLVYHVSSNTWDKIQAPMRRFLRSPNLAVVMLGSSNHHHHHHERVIMVAGVEKRRLSVPKSVRVWEMMTREEEGASTTTLTTWVEVERMPVGFYSQFEEAEAGLGFECVGSGEYVAVTMRGSVDVVLFDYGRKEWRWAPRCPYNIVGGEGLRGVGYEPRLATPAVGLIDPASTMLVT